MPAARSKKTARFGRRRLLLLGAGGGVLALTASVVALVRTRGYDLPAATRSALVVLSPAQYVVVQAAARRICAADEKDVVTPDEIDVAGFVDAYVARVPPKTKRDLLRFLDYIEQLAPPGVGFVSRFSRLKAADQDTVLASLEDSAKDLLRGGFEGLKALVLMGYYRDPRTWRILGYDGPLLGRVSP